VISTLTKALQEPAYKFIFAIFVVFLLFGSGATIYGIALKEPIALILAFLSFIIVTIAAIKVISIVESKAILKATSIEDKIKELEETLKKQFKLITEPRIEETIAEYSREDLIDFIIKCSTSSLNKFEYINDEIINLYKEHGLLELADKPQRSHFQIIYALEKIISDDIIKVKYIVDYLATNEAYKNKGENKFVNGDGMVSFSSMDIKDLDESKIPSKIQEYMNPLLILEASFSIGDKGPGHKHVFYPEYIREEDFDTKKLINKGDNETKSEPKLYGVYKASKEDSRLDLKLYLNIKIPPQENIRVHIESEDSYPDFYIVSQDFSSWTDCVEFELQGFDKEFDTDITYTIPLLEGRKPNIEKKAKLTYLGWIMPHSSISAAWKKKNKT